MNNYKFNVSAQLPFEILDLFKIGVQSLTAICIAVVTAFTLLCLSFTFAYACNMDVSQTSSEQLDLGGNIFLDVTVWKGKLLVHVRKWQMRGGVLRPTQKGIAISPGQFKLVCQQESFVMKQVKALKTDMIQTVFKADEPLESRGTSGLISRRDKTATIPTVKGQDGGSLDIDKAKTVAKKAAPASGWETEESEDEQKATYKPKNGHKRATKNRSCARSDESSDDDQESINSDDGKRRKQKKLKRCVSELFDDEASEVEYESTTKKRKFVKKVSKKISETQPFDISSDDDGQCTSKGKRPTSTDGEPKTKKTKKAIRVVDSDDDDSDDEPKIIC